MCLAVYQQGFGTMCMRLHVMPTLQSASTQQGIYWQVYPHLTPDSDTMIDRSPMTVLIHTTALMVVAQNLLDHWISFLGLPVTLLTNRGIQFPFSLLTEITGLLCTRRYRNHHRLPCASEAFDYVMDWWMVNRSWQTVFYDPIWRRQKLHIDNLVMGKRLGNDRSAGVQNGDSKGPSDKTVRHVHHTLKIVTLMTSIWRKQDGMRK